MSSQSIHNYYNRSNIDATNFIISTSEDSWPTPGILDPISSLETKLLDCFDEVQNEHLNVKKIYKKKMNGCKKLFHF